MKDILSILQREHEATVAELQKEHQAEKQLFESRIAALGDRVAAQQRQYEERPSRQEDLDTIENLKKALEDTNVSPRH